MRTVLRSRFVVLGWALGAVSSFSLHPSSFGQGALTPPGAPAPTLKTLTQIEPRTPITNLPYTISQPGSYYLVTNLTGTTGQHGITILSGNVTLDLMGFALVGVPGTVHGVTVNASVTNLVVANGTVRHWGSCGVSALSASQSCYQNLRFLNNGTAGLEGGQHNAVANCTASGNGEDGIYLHLGGAVRDCTAITNTYHGIEINGGGLVRNCVAVANVGNGIHVGDGSTVIGCTARQNGTGIFTYNATTISGCTVSANAGHGITVYNDCRVTDNVCDSNGATSDAAGILVQNSDNRIDSNNVTDNDRGIDTLAAGNLIIRNSASGNTTNYVFTGVQTFGPTNLITGEISSADGHPWRNFSY